MRRRTSDHRDSHDGHDGHDGLDGLDHHDGVDHHGGHRQRASAAVAESRSKTDVQAIGRPARGSGTRAGRPAP
ncbi:MAG: hypothetical protein ACK5WD_08960, partial [bacterium]